MNVNKKVCFHWRSHPFWALKPYAWYHRSNDGLALSYGFHIPGLHVKVTRFSKRVRSQTGAGETVKERDPDPGPAPVPFYVEALFKGCQDRGRLKTAKKELSKTLGLEGFLTPRPKLSKGASIYGTLDPADGYAIRVMTEAGTRQRPWIELRDAVVGWFKEYASSGDLLHVEFRDNYLRVWIDKQGLIKSSPLYIYSFENS